MIFQSSFIMGYGTGKINVPLCRTHFQGGLNPDYSWYRSNLFLKGPLQIRPKIQVDFPLDSEYDFDIVPQNPAVGMTVGELVDRVIEIYRYIYSAGSNSPSYSAHGGPNDFGIYSHDLDELVLVEAEFSPSDSTIYLVVEPL